VPANLSNQVEIDRQPSMVGSGDGENLSAAREKDEANIRWLLAAVLHHQPEDEPEGEGED
jgi:hypothetical protein